MAFGDLEVHSFVDFHLANISFSVGVLFSFGSRSETYIDVPIMFREHYRKAP